MLSRNIRKIAQILRINRLKCKTWEMRGQHTQDSRKHCNWLMWAENFWTILSDVFQSVLLTISSLVFSPLFFVDRPKMTTFFVLSLPSPHQSVGDALVSNRLVLHKYRTHCLVVVAHLSRRFVDAAFCKYPIAWEWCVGCGVRDNVQM